MDLTKSTKVTYVEWKGPGGRTRTVGFESLGTPRIKDGVTLRKLGTSQKGTTRKTNSLFQFTKDSRLWVVVVTIGDIP